MVLVAALGYFVDLYDLTLFNIVKKESLLALGFSGQALLDQEISLFNYQMLGMMLGGLLWGILGDRRGRVSVLFGSILLYSVANIANAFIVNISQYAILRFIAGVGLAGELGAGITLVSETLHREKRGYGTMIIVTLGALGAVVASQVGRLFGWQNAYLIGGGLGLALLLLRAGTFESGMYHSMRSQQVAKGNFFQLFYPRERLLRYLSCIAIGLPIWFAVGILVNLSDRFGAARGIAEPVVVGTSVSFAYIGLSAGDLLSGLMSQWLRSRRRTIFIFLALSALLTLLYLYLPGLGLGAFYALCLLLGVATGYWAVFVTNASEQFGTNLRSTATNTVPNFVRGAVVPITLSFKYLSGTAGVVNAALIVGGVCLALALAATFYVEETFGKDLDYVER